MTSSSNSTQHSALSYWIALSRQGNYVATGLDGVPTGPPVTSAAHVSCVLCHALLRAQGALSLGASVVHCRKISSMLRHGKSHVPRFFVVTESLEKFVATEILCRYRTQ